MKKTVTLVLSVILTVFCLASCGKTPEDCQKMYNDAEAKTSALQKFAAEVDMTLSVDVGTSSASVVSRTEMKADLAASKYQQTIANSDGSGSSQTVSVYHEAGTTYYSDGYNSYKYAEDDSAAMTSVSHVADFGIPDSAFNEAKCEEENGGYRIEFKAPGESMKSLCDSYLYPVDMMTGVSNDYTLSDVACTAAVNADGYLVSLSLGFSAQFDYSGNASSALIDVTVRYTDVSGKAMVEPPEGYKDYPDYDPDAVTDTGDDDWMDEKDAEAIDAAFSLFEDDHKTPVANYDELYRQYCSEYGKDTMDSIIELILAFGGIAGD